MNIVVKVVVRKAAVDLVMFTVCGFVEEGHVEMGMLKVKLSSDLFLHELRYIRFCCVTVC